MANLIKATPANIVRKATPSGTIVNVAPDNLTTEQRSILTAYETPSVYTIPDIELLANLYGFICRALTELGHKNQLSETKELKIMQDAIFSDIRERFQFFSLKDLELIFKKGARGDFKSKPEEVVMINREQVNRWFTTYHRVNRAEVIHSLKPYEAPKGKPENYSPETDFNSLLSKVQNQEPVTETEWICQTAQHYDRLNNAGDFNLTIEQRKEIYQQERQRVVTQGKNNLLHIKTETRFIFKAFAESQNTENQFEKEVLTNCKIRVFREYVNQLAKQKAA